ncbi:MAG: response regulator transcription factor [Rhizonema sp. PD38]|nr:response regulator transcription factor [Rhizonema sp. PD38]
MNAYVGKYTVSYQVLKILLIDNHELILHSLQDVLRKQYPKAEISTTQTAQNALNQATISQPDLVVMDIFISEKPKMIPETKTGIILLQKLMKNCPNLNIMVLSSHVKALVRIKHDIDVHYGGFTVVNKSLCIPEMLSRVELTLMGATQTKDLRTQMKLQPVWLEVLRLAFEEGLQDKAIAERMIVAERTVRHYWIKLQDVLGIYPEDSKRKGKNIRIQTEIRAREEGLID